MTNYLLLYFSSGLFSVALLWLLFRTEKYWNSSLDSLKRKGKDFTWLFRVSKFIFIPLVFAIGLFLLVTALPYLAGYLFYDWIKKMRKYDKEARYYQFNPLLHQIFLGSSSSDDFDFKACPQELQKFDYLIFPVFYSQSEIDSLSNDKIFWKSLRDMNGEVVLFDFHKELYPVPKGSLLKKSEFFDLKYFFPCDDLFLNNTILSFFLTENVDGESKIIVYKKPEYDRVYIYKWDNIKDLDYLKYCLNYENAKIKCYSYSFFENVSMFLSFRGSRLGSSVSEYRSQQIKNLRNKAERLVLEVEPDLKYTIQMVEKSVFLSLGAARRVPSPHFMLSKKASKSDDNVGLPLHGNPSTAAMDKMLIIENDLKGLEAEAFIDFRSKVFLKTANILFDSVNMDTEFDYSPIIIGYSKFFEREINRSIVQKIRCKLGISMPKYYEKYYDGEGDFMFKSDGEFKVNFNLKDSRSGNYLPPGLGQSIIVFQRMIKVFDDLDFENDDFFKKSLTLNSIRNKSAHAEVVEYDDLIKIRSILFDFYEKAVFEKLEKIRLSLV